MMAPGVLITVAGLSSSLFREKSGWAGVPFSSANSWGDRNVEPGVMGMVVPGEPSPGRMTSAAAVEPSSAGISTIPVRAAARLRSCDAGVTVLVEGSKTVAARAFSRGCLEAASAVITG